MFLLVAVAPFGFIIISARTVKDIMDFSITFDNSRVPETQSLPTLIFIMSNNIHDDQEAKEAAQAATPAGTAQANDPTWIAQTCDILGEGNFPQGCSVSPDGLCVATTTAADATLRLYNTVHKASHDGKPQSWKTALASNVVGEVIRSYDWYPHMQSSNPATCCLAVTGRDQPVQLIDAYTGGIRATYVPMNAMDEMESPTVVKFSPSGDKIVTAGFRTQRMIQIFDSASPGRTSATVTLQLGKTKRSSDGQKGLVSALAFSKMENPLLAVGTYSPGSIYLYDFRQGSQQPSGTIWTGGRCVVGHGKKHASRKRRLDTDTDGVDLFSNAKTQWYAHRAQRGITQLQFDASGKLYSASRNTDAILVWDVRMLSGNPEYTNRPIRGYTSFPINAQTNQRLDFALDDASSRLWVGGFPTDKKCRATVRVYDSSDTINDKLIQDVSIPGCAQGDAINGLSYNGAFDVLAIATGSRRFPKEEDYADSDVEGESEHLEAEDVTSPGSLQLYTWNSLLGNRKEEK